MIDSPPSGDSDSDPDLGQWLQDQLRQKQEERRLADESVNIVDDDSSATAMDSPSDDPDEAPNMSQSVFDQTSESLAVTAETIVLDESQNVIDLTGESQVLTADITLVEESQPFVEESQPFMPALIQESQSMPVQTMVEESQQCMLFDPIQERSQSMPVQTLVEKSRRSFDPDPIKTLSKTVLARMQPIEGSKFLADDLAEVVSMAMSKRPRIDKQQIVVFAAKPDFKHAR